MQKNKDKYIRVLRCLFIIASCLELVMGILEMCNYELPFRRWILWGFFFVYLLNMWGNEYTHREFLLFAITVILGIFLYMNTRINTGIKAPVYIMALKGVDKRKLLQAFLCTALFTSLVIIIAALFFGIGDLYFWVLTKDERISKVCYSLGFSNPNRLQLLLYGILTYILLLYGRKVNRILFAVVMLAYFVMAYLTDCKTGMLVGIFIMLGVICTRTIKIPVLADYIMILFMVGLVLMLVVSFLAAANVEKGRGMELINEFISERMNQLEEYTNQECYNLPYMENWALFSDRNNKNGYDMGYIYIFYYYGIVFAVVYLGFIISAVDKARKRGDSLGMVLILGLCIYLFMETGYYSNYLTRDFLLMTSAVVARGTYEREEKKNISGNIESLHNG